MEIAAGIGLAVATQFATEKACNLLDEILKSLKQQIYLKKKASRLGQYVEGLIDELPTMAERENCAQEMESVLIEMLEIVQDMEDIENKQWRRIVAKFGEKK